MPAPMCRDRRCLGVGRVSRSQCTTLYDMNPFKRHYDVAIVGSGAGGGTLAYGLARQGYKVLLLEQGDYLPREADNTSDDGAFGKKYMSAEPMEICGRRHNFPFHAYVGGATKLYGAALYRLREADFGELRFPDGVSPAWPIRYADLEPYYGQAEALYKVHGDAAADPTEPAHSESYRFPPVPHEPQMERFFDRMRRQGLHISPIPKALDVEDKEKCHVCGTCDGYACPTDGKLDTEVACIRPALQTGNLVLVTHANCQRLLTNAEGDRVVGIELQYQGERVTVEAGIYVLACGVVRSPALLLRSANKAHPNGLANSSGLVGRYLSGHNANFLVVPTFTKVNDLHQKTFAINDYYLGAPGAAYPLGVFQAAGRMPIWLHVSKRWAPMAEAIARRSLLCFLMSEVWPDYENRITLAADGVTQVHYRPNNVRGYRELRWRWMKHLWRAGYVGAYCSRHPGVGIPWHAVGTLRFGVDPSKSVLDVWCRAHDVDNLYVVDSSFLPSAGSVNTSLTVMAQALRVADHLHQRLRLQREPALAHRAHS